MSAVWYVCSVVFVVGTLLDAWTTWVALFGDRELRETNKLTVWFMDRLGEKVGVIAKTIFFDLSMGAYLMWAIVFMDPPIEIAAGIGAVLVWSGYKQTKAADSNAQLAGYSGIVEFLSERGG